MKRSEKELFRRLRVFYEYADELYFYVRPSEDLNKLLKVRYRVEGLNDEFTDNLLLFWKGAPLNLLDSTVDELGIYYPAFIVLEPDYLIDVSSLAECYKEYGNHPANYFMSRLCPIDNARPLLVGNIANLFLDEWIYAKDNAPDYIAAMKKAFRQYPIELAACNDLYDSAKEKAFFDDCKLHFDHIRETVQHVFKAEEYRLDKSDAVLEPSYVCEALGIQGRLDYMQRDMSSFIEMKSGKADEYSDKGKILPKENNRVQMLLYMAMLEFCEGYNHTKQRPYLLYTRYPILYPARTTWKQVKKIIALRNQIVAAEYGTQLHTPAYTAELLNQITPSVLNVRKLRGKFWECFLLPQIMQFEQNLSLLNSLEKEYFYTLYRFITKELYLSKTGGMLDDKRLGMASLWLHSLDEKRQAGEILYDLILTDNQAGKMKDPSVSFSIPEYDEEFLPNFRQGDVVVLYERNLATDNVTNRMVFKGSIDEITDCLIRIRLRSPQRNSYLFPQDSLYAIEHDSMDTAFRNMYYGLSSFMTANKERRALLLTEREPLFMNSMNENSHFIDDFDRVAQKAWLAQDYFLLVGPPGTGKTSKALNQMVRMFYKTSTTNILLLAYTNRAVDEICKSLSSIDPPVDYLRVGSELSCDTLYRHHLLENVLCDCKNRKEVLKRMSDCRIYVGTVASISSKRELFKIKRFDVAIIDEATQILEPQLLGILCEKVPDGRNAVGKFILIGDHKQLPAVVLQDPVQSEVHAEELRRIGILNLKDSLFERLYRYHLQKKDSPVIDMLCKQGRMHPDVAKFANETFYNGKLEPVGLPHQLEKLVSPISFIPSILDHTSLSGKANYHEASLVASCASRIWDEYGDSFDPKQTLGIITPYRNQIALIRKELKKLNIFALMDVSVDTVERYQGSERDVIIYSFCVNSLSQLRTLPNLIEENGALIDRKLNVVLTRARKRLIIIGNPEMLCQDPIYASLIRSLSV